MERASVHFESILRRLARIYPGACPLEELALLVIPPYNVLKTLTENIAAQKENHAKILDTLILLDDQGYIALNPVTDESSITIKGLIKINNDALCN
ncbi:MULTISPECIES: hypothetical protein [Flavobacterium]|uniref:hypothetical protein n=1 Tax=Flavobacterium TaxID=237 RepID=UPI0021156CD5|nr:MULTISPECIES: hypothetical protein [Flavobacterium]UUF12424.1 hypothetical protein NLJ00_14305 [Flavobacterium panici]